MHMYIYIYIDAPAYIFRSGRSPTAAGWMPTRAYYRQPHVPSTVLSTATPSTLHAASNDSGCCTARGWGWPRCAPCAFCTATTRGEWFWTTAPVGGSYIR